MSRPADAAGEFALVDSLISSPIMFFSFVILGVKAWISRRCIGLLEPVRC
jgi:hypothetical protein